MLSNSMIIRTAWLYSTFGNNFIKTMLRLGKEKKEINVVYDQTGSPTYATDLAQAVIEIIKQVNSSEKNFKAGIYHYSNEGVCSWFDVATEIIIQSGLDCRINPILTAQYPTPAKRPAYSVFNKAKIKNTFQISVPWWKDSLKTCLGKIK
jgi:dTDP-4-dehydrorhamnose reductase